MIEKDFGNITFESAEERRVRGNMLELLKACPIPEEERLSNLGLFLNSKNLSRILFLQHIYTQIVEVPGIIVEFGTRWGQNAAVFSALRGIYDPFHRHRKIVVFDTFQGFPTIHAKDGDSVLMQPGTLSVTPDYPEYLRAVLRTQEQDNPLSHLTKFEVIQGDATQTFKDYLERNPQTIVAMAYFDFDIYEPTRKCLDLLRPHLTKGSLLGFDELNDPDSPGETAALAEVFGLPNIRLKRFPITSRVSYFIHE